MTDERRTVVERDGVRLAVRDSGGRGRPLLCLHGLASSLHMFDLVAPLLTDDLRVVAYDQRGHGESSKPSSGYGFDQVTEDAAAVMRALRLRSPIALGHSWGANVVLELAVRHPRMLSGAILLDGGFMSMKERMDWKTAKETLAPPPIAGMHIDDYLAMVRTFMPDDMEITAAHEAMFRSLMRIGRDGRIRPRLSRANHMRILHALWAQDPVELLRRVRVPTLVIAMRQRGAEPQDDAFVAAKELARRRVEEIGEPVRFTWLEGIHDVPLQHPDALADVIRGFAARV